MGICGKMPRKYSAETELVMFLKTKGFNSVQIRDICINILQIKNLSIYQKIIIYAKNVEIEDARRRFKSENIMGQLKIKGLI